MLCGRINMTLGYLIVAEQMFSKAHLTPEYAPSALKYLGDLALHKLDYDAALHYYKQSLQLNPTWEMAY
jgi:uncharacterized protein HemY